MLSKLSTYFHESSSVQIVRSVVSFTFIDFESMMWIIYISSREQKPGRLVCKYVSEHFLRHCTSKLFILGLSADIWQKMRCIGRAICATYGIPYSFTASLSIFNIELYAIFDHGHQVAWISDFSTQCYGTKRRRRYWDERSRRQSDVKAEQG